ncbi:hypothetical protein RchiOBHm_Chr1g0356191 [Rosa chinensis]|uniref:Uncharacterized protein n=1 Tax=Rosa chinensis TaxID=74649 RepID=A0A2P6SHM0_ROSCH|nr:hypothetical protein RchiOBHm_Chr1g0356191 [Rosa chinensis]
MVQFGSLHGHLGCEVSAILAKTCYICSLLGLVRDSLHDFFLALILLTSDTCGMRPYCIL